MREESPWRRIPGWPRASVRSRFALPPAFDPAQLQDQFWGTMTLTFTDCNNGAASWQPVAAGYTAGSMPLQRLTTPAGLTCP